MESGSEAKGLNAKMPGLQCPLWVKSGHQAGLFDNLIGAEQNRSGHVNAKRLCGFQIDTHIEFCGFQNWQIGGLFAFKNSAGIDTDLSIDLRTLVP